MSKTTYTLAEAAALLSCHVATLRRAIRIGALPAARLGREFRISRTDLQAFWTMRGGSDLFGADEDLPPRTEDAAPLPVPRMKKISGPIQLKLLD